MTMRSEDSSLFRAGVTVLLVTLVAVVVSNVVDDRRARDRETARHHEALSAIESAAIVASQTRERLSDVEQQVGELKQRQHVHVPVRQDVARPTPIFSRDTQFVR